jgi:hypothetical protein
VPHLANLLGLEGELAICRQISTAELLRELLRVRVRVRAGVGFGARDGQAAQGMGLG